MDLSCLKTWELLCKLADVDPDSEDVEEASLLVSGYFQYTYSIDNIEEVSDLLEDLIPYCGEGSSKLSGKYYTGFADRANGAWLLHKEL